MLHMTASGHESTFAVLHLNDCLRRSYSLKVYRAELIPLRYMLISDIGTVRMLLRLYTSV